MKADTKRRIGLYLVVLLALLIFYLGTSLQKSLHTITLTDYFDTVCEISVYSKTSKPLRDTKKILKNLDLQFSAENPDSELYQSNHGSSKKFSEDLEKLIEFGREFTNENPGCFSIYLHPLVKLWDIKNNPGIIPDVTDAMKAVDTHTSVNLGAIAKGYAADKIAKTLKNNGVTSAMINLGGNAYAIGKKPTGDGWRIGIQSPKDPEEIIGVITACDLAVITSGDYQRYFELNGKRYHHIFDPNTGFPADSGLRSVTVISEDALLADALSTAAFTAGVEEGNELLKRYNARGIFITDDTVYFSKDLENIFRQTDFSYRYKFLF